MEAKGAVANAEADKLTDYPLFDWLRFTLASVVVLGHAGFQFAPFLTGHLAVQVFFALSGWLIGGILLRTKNDELPRFFFNRATRIWIPYALAIVLLYGLAAAKEGVSFYWLKYLILDVTFTHQLFTFFPAASVEMPLDGSGNQFWSIAVEEQFYLLAPLLMLFVPKGKSPWTWAPVAFVTTLLGWNTAAIALGVCAAWMEAQTGFSAWRSTRVVAIAVAVLGAAFLALFELDPHIAPIFAVALVVAVAVPGRRSSVAIVAGGLSYPLYLNHYLGVFAVSFVGKRYLSINHATFVAAEYILNVALALALYWFLDRQIQVRRNAWYSPRVGIVLGLVAYALVGIGLAAGTTMHLLGPHG